MAPSVSVPSRPSRSLEPHLRSALISKLLSTSALQDLNNTLLASCQASGWLDAVRDRAIQLLHSGECHTYGQVMASLQKESKGRSTGNTVAGRLAKGSYTLANGGSKKVDVAIPKTVVEEGRKAVKMALDRIVVIEDIG
ncbi:hypothetical protein MMC07_005188 [Pseudocyphellaria aurata]|nr:hypothetical protein [Pseudocyphellaria aurata]